MKTIRAFKKLADAVVLQAADDWRKLYQGKDVPGESLDSIRLFFKSGYGQFICGEVNSLYILSKLEKERKQYMENEGGLSNVKLERL